MLNIKKITKKIIIKEKQDIVMAMIFAFLRLPKLGKKDASITVTGAAWQYRHLVLGALGIFVYVFIVP